MYTTNILLGINNVPSLFTCFHNLSPGNFVSWATLIPILQMRKLRKPSVRQLGVVILSSRPGSLTSLWVKTFRSGKDIAYTG